ncbi:glycosyltransferase family 2 protein [Gimibacter soli]|uniref:Glycosyltransferase family 2 protein n=1 Tax=Gimibacter soli TaxID=3024400 RepID=A0AAE9XS85_9PROT|nr:glycosyltransferase family 2 protein [Gimibacter soli]WCL53075.1 glycosyltransferase family 2 protein [Gimibacter soli]
MQIIITMAGFGSRFRDAGYDLPKYRIPVHGVPLFDWSLVSLSRFYPQVSRTVFIVRRADEAGDWILARAKALGVPDPVLVELDAPTKGQADSALLAGPHLKADLPILIYNIDTFTEPAALDPARVRGQGWIPCFPAAGESWSFVKADADGKALEVREKTRISDHATIGLYHFASFRLFEAAVVGTYGGGATEKGETYVAPVYNWLIEQGHEVFIDDLPFDAVRCLGVPADVSFEAGREAPAAIQDLQFKGKP